MATRTVKQTMSARGSPLSAAQRREALARDIVKAHGERGDPLRALARILASATDTKTQIEAARALAPYLYPQLKAVEVSGADGAALTVNILRAGPPSCPPSAPDPAPAPAPILDTPDV